jgi:hypothetical protein
MIVFSLGIPSSRIVKIGNKFAGTYKTAAEIISAIVRLMLSGLRMCK